MRSEYLPRVDIIVSAPNLNDPAAEDGVPVVQHRRLTRRYRALRLVKQYLCLGIASRRDPRPLLRLAVAVSSRGSAPARPASRRISQLNSAARASLPVQLRLCAESYGVLHRIYRRDKALFRQRQTKPAMLAYRIAYHSGVTARGHAPPRPQSRRTRTSFRYAARLFSRSRRPERSRCPDCLASAR